MKRQVFIEIFVLLLATLTTGVLILLICDYTSDNTFIVKYKNIKFETSLTLLFTYFYSFVIFIIFLARQISYHFKHKFLNWTLLSSSIVLIYACYNRFKSNERLVNAFQLDHSPVPTDLIDLNSIIMTLGCFFTAIGITTIFFIMKASDSRPSH